MKNVLKNILGLTVILGLTACGAADSGFNAPFGSAISGPAGGSFALASSSIVQTSFVVTLPNGEPASGVQIQFICFQCAILDTNPPGNSASIKDRNDLAPVTPDDTLYVVKTNGQGQYTVWVQLQPPAALGGSTYTAKLSASAGAASAETTFTVTTPSTE